MFIFYRRFGGNCGSVIKTSGISLRVILAIDLHLL
jgi:hypothetical protein